MTAPTGEQFELKRRTDAGEVRAVVTQVAASLRELTVGGVAAVQPYRVDSIPPFAAGIVLVPWPGRVEDGVWRLGDEEQQLDLTEPARNNAIHGLLRNTAYTLVEHTPAAVTLAAHVFPQHGYPFHLATSVRYALTDDGITVSHEVRSLAAAPAPFALGTHPFLTVGGAHPERLMLTVHAATRFERDARLVPLRETPVEGTAFDLRRGRRLGELELDDAFGGLEPVGGVTARLAAEDDREVQLWQDAGFGFVQVFMTRRFPTPDGPTLAVAIEPMTAPGNALNTGVGLRWLQPGETWRGEWGIRYRA